MTLNKLSWLTMGLFMILASNGALSSVDAPFTGLEGSRQSYHSYFLSSKKNRLDSTLTDQAIDQAWEITQIMQSMYPPSEFIYVALGRSPTIVMAIFEILKEHNPYIMTSFLPMSLRDMSAHMQPKLVNFINRYVRAMTHFKYGENRKILIFDFVSSGETLRLMKQMFPDFEFLALGSMAAYELMKKMHIPFHALPDGSESLLKFLTHEKADEYSPYASLPLLNYYQTFYDKLPQPHSVNRFKYMTLINYLANRKNINNVRHCRQIFK